MRIGGCFGAIPPAKDKILDYSNFIQVKLSPYHYALDFTQISSSLTHLTFGPHFNSPVDNLLPLSLTHLTFDGDYSFSVFNQPINHLPPSLIYLSLSEMFNQPIDNLPSTLTHLTLRRFFNHSINNLPSSLTYLYLRDFEQPVNSLPSSLMHLHVPHLNFGETNFSIISLPNLISLSCDSIPSNTKLPNSVEELNIENTLSSFPPNLKHLNFGIEEEIENLSLPSSLLTLNIYHNDPQFEMPLLPPNLQKLNLKYAPKLPLPLTLVEIDITSLNNTPIELIQHIFTLPNLTKIGITYNNSSIETNNPISLPPKLMDLSVWDQSHDKSFANFINLIDFNSAPLLESLGIYTETPTKLSSEYPPSLTSLETDKLTFKGELPKTLKRLSFNMKGIRPPFILPPLPENLTHLYCINCQPPPSFPSELLSLDMSVFKKPLPDFPPKLKRLILSRGPKNIPILPPSLKKIVAPEIMLLPSTFIPPFIEYVNVKFSKKLPKFPVTVEDLTFADIPESALFSV